MSGEEVFVVEANATQADPLPSWNESEAKGATLRRLDEASRVMPWVT